MTYNVYSGTLNPTHCHSHLTQLLWSIPAHNLIRIWHSLAVFAQISTECPYALQWDAPFPLKFAPLHVVIWMPI